MLKFISNKNYDLKINWINTIFYSKVILIKL